MFTRGVRNEYVGTVVSIGAHDEWLHRSKGERRGM